MRLKYVRLVFMQFEHHIVFALLKDLKTELAPAGAILNKQ